MIDEIVDPMIRRRIDDNIGSLFVIFVFFDSVADLTPTSLSNVNFDRFVYIGRKIP